MTKTDIILPTLMIIGTIILLQYVPTFNLKVGVGIFFSIFIIIYGIIVPKILSQDTKQISNGRHIPEVDCRKNRGRTRV
jgi:hypothetical protein